MIGLLTGKMKEALEEEAVPLGYRSWYSDSLLAGRSGRRIPVGARFSEPVQTDTDTHRASCTMGTGSLPRVKWSGVALTTYPI